MQHTFEALAPLMYKSQRPVSGAVTAAASAVAPSLAAAVAAAEASVRALSPQQRPATSPSAVASGTQTRPLFGSADVDADDSETPLGPLGVPNILGMPPSVTAAAALAAEFAANPPRRERRASTTINSSVASRPGRGAKTTTPFGGGGHQHHHQVAFVADKDSSASATTSQLLSIDGKASATASGNWEHVGAPPSLRVSEPGLCEDSVASPVAGAASLEGKDSLQGGEGDLVGTEDDAEQDDAADHDDDDAAAAGDSGGEGHVPADEPHHSTLMTEVLHSELPRTRFAGPEVEKRRLKCALPHACPL